MLYVCNLSTGLVALLTLVMAAPSQDRAQDAVKGVRSAAVRKALARQNQIPELFHLGGVIDRAVQKVATSIVTIETFGGYLKDKKKPSKKKKKKKKKKNEKLGPLRRPGFLQAQGASTGIIISEDGWILTSRFVLNYDPQTIIVTLADGRKLTAEEYGEDHTRGLALLKVEAKGLPVPEFVAQDAIKVGQWAFALGRTFGPKEPTVHAGIVSAVRRINGKAIQCDAYTSPANYGGPLIDLRGRILGLICPLSPKGDVAGADWYDSGIGFAANLSGIDEVLAGMKEGTVYEKGVFGVRIDLTDLGPGAKISRVNRKSAAQHSGLKKGDSILTINGAKVRNPMHLRYLLGQHMAAAFVTVRYKRKKDAVIVEVLVILDSPGPG